MANNADGRKCLHLKDGGAQNLPMKFCAIGGRFELNKIRPPKRVRRTKKKVHSDSFVCCIIPRLYLVQPFGDSNPRQVNPGQYGQVLAKTKHNEADDDAKRS